MRFKSVLLYQPPIYLHGVSWLLQSHSTKLTWLNVDLAIYYVAQPDRLEAFCSEPLRRNKIRRLV
jgi:hypothetical protein